MKSSTFNEDNLSDLHHVWLQANKKTHLFPRQRHREIVRIAPAETTNSVGELGRLPATPLSELPALFQQVRNKSIYVLTPFIVNKHNMCAP